MSEQRTTQILEKCFDVDSGSLASRQGVTADSNNSSVLDLDSENEYTFTGTATSTLGVVGLQWS